MIFILVKLNFFFFNFHWMVSNFHWGISIFHWGFFHFPLRIFPFSIEDFSTPLSPSYEEGVLTPVPKPYAPTIGARDVAGYAIASPEFWYRQRSLCPYGAGDDFLRNRVAIVLRLIGDFCAVLHRLPVGLALCSKLSTRRFTPHKKSQLCCVKK